MKRAASHPGRLLVRELAARKLFANRLSLDIGMPSGSITDILNSRRSITADTAVRFGRYFGNSAQFWLDLQSQYDSGAGEGRGDRETGEAGGRSVACRASQPACPLMVVEPSTINLALGSRRQIKGLQ